MVTVQESLRLIDYLRVLLKNESQEKRMMEYWKIGEDIP
jgi:hypothetical protein